LPLAIPLFTNTPFPFVFKPERRDALPFGNDFHVPLDGDFAFELHVARDRAYVEWTKIKGETK
jgi:hypothetical protein